jgi:hypothetical protein
MVYPMAAMIGTADPHSWVQPPGSGFGQRQRRRSPVHVQLGGSRHLMVYPMAAMIGAADHDSWV